MVASRAAQPSLPPPRVIERGPHHVVLETVHQELAPNGQWIARTNIYTTLATGMNYLLNGQWTQSRSEFAVVDGAAVARQGPWQVSLAANLNSPGAVDLLGPDQQKRLRGGVLALLYTDAATGQSLVIAQVKDCQGALLSPDRVYYLDAFEGECSADVRYTYSPSEFHQDIILQTAPPSPAAWGLSPDTTRLEVVSEFIEMPEATLRPEVIQAERDPILRQLMVEPDLVATEIAFGPMTIIRGKAFLLSGDNEVPEDDTVLTGQVVQRQEGRVLLIEQANYRSLLPYLQQLPQMGAFRPEPKERLERAVTGDRLWARSFPPPAKGARNRWSESRLAGFKPPRQGLVLDYTVINCPTTCWSTIRRKTRATARIPKARQRFWLLTKPSSSLMLIQIMDTRGRV